ncbi:RIB43A-like with coiled-coils protein 2 [Chanos chanos]|uniref:RIB43A-like with coiled-coils protein 2 n=1 Tax=Chanos chanos TaxID=29144 RepID=A0A6J2WGL6_CHACN|nr:RIB43A-like with coiled-coils protein 2 [Chanos chanos]
MNTVELLSDRLEAARIERRRNRELQRQDRIFNARVRTIGIDKDALDHQVQERKEKEEAESLTLKGYAEDLLHGDRVACLLDHRQRKDERLLQKAIMDFRQNFQQRSSRREFDLNDPDALKKQDSVQMLPGLVGEDPGSVERRRRQQEQLRSWSSQQQHELVEAHQRKKREDLQYDQTRIALDNRALELQKTEEENKRALAIATKDFNLALAAETAGRRQRERYEEEENKKMDILNHLQGELLSKSQDQSASLRGYSRLRSDSYLGLSLQQLQHFTDLQLQQAEEKKRALLAQKQEELEQDRVRVESARAVLLLERKQARINKEMRQAMDNANAKLAQEQQARKKYLEEQVYTNVPDESYFSQFNTSTR